MSIRARAIIARPGSIRL